MTTQSTDSHLLTLGKVVKPHGLKGGLVVYSYGSELLWQLSTLLLRSDSGELHEVTVKGLSPLPKGTILMTIEGVRFRDQAEALRGYTICIPRDVAPPPEDGEVYLADLLGARVQVESGAFLGVVKGLYDSPAPYPTLVVQTDEGEELFLPLPRENFIDFNEKEQLLIVAWDAD